MPDAPTPRSPVDRLRDELDRDARILQALSPGSDAHQRLASRIGERTRQLLDSIEEQEERDRRFRAAMLAESTRRQAARLSEGAQARLAGGAFVIIGIGIGYIGWGTWWLVIAGVVLVLGLISLFAPPDRR